MVAYLGYTLRMRTLFRGWPIMVNDTHTRRRRIDGWDITTSVFERRTSAILEIYIRFRFQPFARNLDIVLHQATEFRRNRSTHCGNVTLYPFLKMAAATAKYYFRFRICWCHCLQKVKVYQQTKFCRDISIGRWDIITAGFENIRHIGILLLISISTSSLQSACYSASGYRISSKSDHPLRKYDVISISQDSSCGR